MCLCVCSVGDEAQGLETLGKHSTAVFSPESNIVSFVTAKDNANNHLWLTFKCRQTEMPERQIQYVNHAILHREGNTSRSKSTGSAHTVALREVLTLSDYKGAI